MKPLRDALLEHSPQLLRAIADMNHIVLPEGGGRDHAAAFLAEQLAHPDTVARAYESLPAAGRAVLDAIVLKGGRIKAFQMLRDSGEIRSFGPVALARDKPWLTPANLTERLWYLGLIQQAFEVSGEFRGEVFYIPDEIMQWLPKPAATSADVPLAGAAAPDSVSDHADAMLWDMFTLMAYVAREEPGPTAAPSTGSGQAGPRTTDNGGRQTSDAVTLLSVEDLRRIESELLIQESAGAKGVSPSPRLALLVRIARTAKLIRPVSELGVRLGSEARAWLRGTRQSARLRLFEPWKRERAWNELLNVPSLKIEATGWRNDPRLAREAIVRHLARCQPFTWITVASFVAGIKQHDPDFQRPDGDYDRWHIRDVESGKLLTGFQHWNQVEGALIAYMLEGPLRWLGVVSIGGAAGQPTSFRIGEFGARALGLSEADLPEPASQRFIVQGDYDVLVPEGVPLYTRFQLERMVERVRWDRISTYRLTRESLTRLLRRNVTIEQVMAFLKRGAREPFPPNVAFTLKEWAAKYGEISLRRAAVLHTRDQHLLAELQHHPELQTYILEVLSPMVALVAAERLEELHARLRALGYSPRIDRSPL